MITPALPPALRHLVGPDSLHMPEGAGSEDLTNALRYAGGTDGTRPGKYGFTGAEVTPEHFCELDGDAYRWCATQPAGGLTYCLRCGIPIFVPPETCLEYLELADDAELTIDLEAGTRRFTS